MKANTVTSGVTSTSPSGSGTLGGRKPPFQGPCYLKMLVSNLVAGSIIGKNGTVISSIESSTGASMKLSPSSTFFPKTSDRIVVMSGDQDQINRALSIVLEKVGEVAAVQCVPESSRESSMMPNCELNCKIVVPNSAVSGIIGKAGNQIKQLQEDTGAKIQISNREQGMSERIVSISGPLESIHNAAFQVAAVVQEDTNLKDHMHVSYSPVHGGGGNVYGVGGMGFAGYGQFVGGGGGAGSYPYPYHAGGQGGGSPTAQPSVNDLEQLMMEQCEIIMEVPDSSMGAVIGKGGVNLTEIMRSTGATVKLSKKGELVPGTQCRKVTVSGTVSAVHRAHARLLLRLKDIEAFGSRSGGSLPYGSGGQLSAVHSSSTSAAQHGGYSQYGMHGAYGQLASYQQQYAHY